MKITFLDRASFHENIRINSPNFVHEWYEFANTKPEEIVEHCVNSQIIVTNKVPIDRKTLESCPNIQHIAVTATGYNIIDISLSLIHI